MDYTSCSTESEIRYLQLEYRQNKFQNNRCPGANNFLYHRDSDNWDFVCPPKSQYIYIYIITNILDTVAHTGLTGCTPRLIWIPPPPARIESHIDNPYWHIISLLTTSSLHALLNDWIFTSRISLFSKDNLAHTKNKHPDTTSCLLMSSPDVSTGYRFWDSAFSWVWRHAFRWHSSVLVDRHLYCFHMMARVCGRIVMSSLIVLSTQVTLVWRGTSIGGNSRAQY